MVEVCFELGGGRQDLIPGFLEGDASHLGVTGKLSPDTSQVPAETHLARHLADFLIRQPEDFGHFPDGRSGAEGIVVGHHGGPAVAVLGEHIVDDLIAFIPCKVHIDVRRIHATRVQKAFKKEVVADGIHMGDAEGVGNNGCSGTSPAARPSGFLSDVRHHQEIVGKVFFPNNLHLVGDALPHSRRDFSVPTSASPERGMIEAMKGFFIVHALKVGEYDAAEIPIREAGFSNLEGIVNGDGCMGKLVDHGLGRVQDIVFPADILRGQAGELAVQGYGPEDAMEPELVFSNEIHPVRGHRRNFCSAGKGIALGHPVTGRHFDKEIFYAVPLEGFEEFEIVGQNHETAPVFSEGSREIKGLVTVAVGDDPGKIGIPMRVFDQKKRAPFISDEFATHDGLDSRFLGGLDKKNQSIKAVGVGQSQPVHAVFFGGLAELFNGTDTPSLGVVGVDMEMDEGIHGIFTTGTQHGE